MELSIESSYKNYLKLVNLDESKMLDIQKVETKRAFVAGFGSCLKMMSDHIADLPEIDGVIALDNLETEVTEFFNSEIRAYESN